MRQFLAAVGAGALVGACSLIYNPNNITKTDAAVPKDAPPDMKIGPQDAPEMIIDANAAEITLTSVEPDSILEGQGSGGSRQAVLVVHGMNIVAGATISIAATNGSDTPMVTSMAGAEVVGADHDFIAVPVTAAVNTSCGSGSIPLTVTVTQAGGSASTGWSLSCLPEVNQGSDLAVPTAQPNMYSEVVLTGSAKITAANSTGPLIVRATADIKVGGNIDVSGNGATAGPGASPGGAASAMGGGAGGGGAGGTLSGGGGGGGYATKGTDGTAGTGGPAVGDPALTGGYAANYASGGGGAVFAGGGGGGTIELTAGGTLTAGTITSKGGAGGSGIGNGGGGGAGGTIVLRGSAVTAGALTVTGGTAASSAGAGAAGRIRIDSPTVSGGASGYAGFSFDPMAPYITNSPTPTLTLHGTAGARYDMFTIDEGGNIKDEEDNKLLGAATGQVMPQVHWGWNKVCVTPHSATASPTVLETASCVEIAFLP